MRIDLEKLAAYELVQHRELADIHSEGFYLIHKKSGARIAVVENEDPNKVFYIGFRTPPTDNTGVPHIIEHTVLCGSEKFPVKDPFIELVKGSMNTFLNAMTYPDKTVYPVASTNDADFRNLMDVYMDAVLHPNIYQEPNIFKQEGWHYDLTEPDGELTVNGIVYNEMKGAYSVADSVLEREILRSLYPDTPYANDSGGAPEEIPNLTYEEYLAFHRTNYHPSNAYLFLYGDMDTTERLEWLDRAYLSAYDRIHPGTEIPLQEAPPEPVKVECFYPISSEESEEGTAYLSYNWSVGTSLDPIQYVAFDILAYSLLTSPGAPVKQALLDAGIGDDIYGGYDGGLLQPTFSVVARNTDAEKMVEFGRIVTHVLTEQAEKGMHKATLLSAINGAEFRFREADFGRIPKGLIFGLQILDSWLYDETKPFLHLDELNVYETLRREVDNGYFEELIWKYLLGNQHVSLLCLRPKKGILTERENDLKAKLSAYRASLTEEEVEALIRETGELAAYQEEPSAPEDLEKIPLLSREDMKKTTDPHSNAQEQIGDVYLLWHDYETNGIIYLDFLFDIRHIPEEQVPYLAILRTLMGRMDTEEYAFVDLSNEINLHTGGVDAEVHLFDVFKEEAGYRPTFEIRIRTLEKNLDKAMELAQSMMLRTVFDDEKRLYEILAMTKSQKQVSLRESGHTVASTRVMSQTSAKARYDELLHGIAYYRVLEKLVNDFDSEKDHLKQTLKDLVRSIFQSSGLLISVTCPFEGYDAVRQKVGNIRRELFADDSDRSAKTVAPLACGSEGFTDASQIQYVATGGDFVKKGYSYNGSLLVFRNIMNFEYLWMNLRDMGGAYGCSCSVSRRGEITFSSYRDPHLQRTLGVYRGVPEYLEQFDVSERDMTRYVIGTFSEMDAPLTPVAMGRRSLRAWISGLTQEMLQQTRDEVLHAEASDIRALAPLVAAALDGAHCCVIGNEDKIREEAALFDHTEAL